MKQFWAFLRDASNSKFWLVIAALIIAGGMTVTIQIGRPPGPAQDTPPVIEGLPIEDAPADVDGPEGWSGVESLTITAAWAAQQPAFQLIHPDSGEPVWQDNANARVCQWETQAALIGGEIPPNVPQEFGDCTSQGAATAIERMQSGGGIRGPPAEFREVSTMWLYGVGRVWIAQGRFGPGDGCSGAAIAQAARDYGVLPLDTPGLPSYTRETELQAECDRQLEAIKTRYQGLMRLVVEGRWDVSFADRQAVLSQAIEAYCNEHQSELVKGKGRSREFTHGVVSWKKTPEGVKVVDGRTKDDLTEEFIDQHELRPRLHELLESISVCGETGSKEHRSAADFFDIALELSLTRAKLAYKAGRLTLAQLELVGLTWDKGQDKFTFKPAKQVVRTEANLAEVA